MKRTLLVLGVFIFVFFVISGAGQNLRAARFEIKTDGSGYNGGDLLITVSGKTRKIARDAQNAWIVNGGRDVVYSFNERSRGFEGEGQGLKIYHVASRKTRHIMSEGSVVTGLTETRLRNGKLVLLVSMTDGGLGGSYFAVVDPTRGQVLSLNFAELKNIEGDTINLAFYKEEDWEVINEERGWEEVKSPSAIARPTRVFPEKTQTLDLNRILKNTVIYNKTNEELGREYERKFSSLRIYQWRPKDNVPDKEYFLMAVIKDVPKTLSPLRISLQLLFADATPDEKKDGWESAVFGMKFEGVILKDGVATIKFSQPMSKKAMPSFAGKMFLESVEKTAKQFSTVKEVKICETGGSKNAFDITPTIPQCQN